MKKDEFYFTPTGSESELWIVHDIIEKFCNENEYELVYFREFKNGHEPMYRECKIIGNKYKIAKFLEENYISIQNINKKHESRINSAINKTKE